MEYPKLIYAIQHKITKKIYIGITNSLESRYKSHMSLLKNNKHTAPLMQEEYNKYGGIYDVFVLDEVRSFSERFKEYEWMRFYNTQNPEYGYNAQDKGGTSKAGVLPFRSGRPERLFSNTTTEQCECDKLCSE
jgi:hypothetical protein